jgi:hypothetical protein
MKPNLIWIRYGLCVAVVAWIAFYGQGLKPASFSVAEEILRGGSGERFIVIMDGEAVQDTKTGLIWQQSPDAFHGVWTESISHCRDKQIGRKEWRLPTAKELASLADRAQHDPALPQRHPFSNVKSAIFWTATPSATDEMLAWHVSFLSGEVVTDQKSQTRRAWCVTGEQSAP